MTLSSSTSRQDPSQHWFAEYDSRGFVQLVSANNGLTIGQMSKGHFSYLLLQQWDGLDSQRFGLMPTTTGSASKAAGTHDIGIEREALRRKDVLTMKSAAGR